MINDVAVELELLDRGLLQGNTSFSNTVTEQCKYRITSLDVTQDFT